jgi:hypothetical protein
MIFTWIKNKDVKLTAITHCLLISMFVFLSGCIGANKVEIKTKKSAKTKSQFLPVSVTNVAIINHQVVISGNNLESISHFLIKDGVASTTLQIESKTNNKIIANTLSNVTFAAGKILDFILSNAEAASTFTVNFSLCDSTLGGKSFNCLITPNDKEVLSYDAASGKWKPRAVNGLSYQGAWDASDPLPTTTTAGDYFIVSVANAPYNVGDWIVFNGATYDQISNSNVITSIFGRNGVVTANEGDYILDKLGDVDLTTTPPMTGDVLKFNGTKWIPGVVSAGSGGTVTNVTGSGPLSITNGSSTPAITISQANTTTNGYLTNTDWNTFNNKQPSIAAGTTAQYYRGDKTWQALDTIAVPENTNLYFTNARTLGVPLTGFSTATGSVVATDSILAALGKLQGQLNLKSDSATIVDWSTAGVATLEPTRLNLATGDRVVVTTAGGVPTPSSVTTTQLGHLSGVTSSVQTQLNSKQATIDKTTVQDVSKVRVYGANATNYVEITAPALAANKILTLPDTDGSNGHVLTTDGAGTLRWAAPSGGGGGGTPDPGSVTNTEVSATANIAQSKIANLTTDLAGKEPTLTAAGNTTTYYRGDKTWAALNTSVVPEVTNLYFTNARVLGVPLAGLNTSLTGAVVATDSILEAFGKTQNKLNGFVDWSTAGVATLDPTRLNLTTANRAIVTNATGTPVVSSVTTTELGYVSGATSNIQTQLNAKQATIDKTTVQDVSKIRIYGANTTNYVELSAATLTGNRTLAFPDSNGATGNVLTTDGSGNLSWSNLATTSPVTSVNTQTGAVTLTTTNIAEGTNFYYTNARGIASTITAPTLSNSAIATGDTLQVVVGKLQGQFNNILSMALTGFSTATSSAITAADTIIGGFGKLQAQINTLNASDSNKLSKNTNDSITATVTVAGAGDIIVPTTPAGVTSAVNKSYVDTQVSSASNQWSASSGNVYRSTGYVGIGTTTPVSPLEVAGVIHSTSGGVRFPDGTTQTTAATNSGVNNTMISGWPDAIKCTITNPTWGTVLLYPEIMPYSVDGLYYYKSRQGYWLMFNSSGAYSSSIGITTTTDCNSNIATLYASGKAFNFVKGPAAQWLQNGSDAYYNAGKVGIGTNAPTAAKLQVSGDDLDYNLALDNYSNTTGSRATAIAQRRALGTAAAPLGITAGTVIGGNYYSGYHSGGAFSGNIAAIRAVASENFTATTQGTDLVFRTTPPGTAAGVESVIFKGNGNVGFNTSTPRGGIEIASGPAWSANNIGVNLMISGSRNNAIGFLDYQGNNPFAIGSFQTIGFGILAMPVLGDITTAPNYRFVISNTGNVGIGTSTPTAKLEVSGNVLATSFNSSAAYLTTGGISNGSNGNILSSGTNSAACYNPGWGFFGYCTSLRATKREIQPLNLGLNTVLKLRPVSFTWKSTNERDLGFIAEEVEKVDPLLAQYTKDKLSGVRYNSLSSLLAKAIQEFYGKFLALEKIVEKLIAGEETNRRDIASIEEKMAKQDAEIKMLRQQNENLKNDIAEIKKALKAK